MDNSNCKTMPGFEQYQSKAEQLKQAEQGLGMFDPLAFNPSNQEVSMKDRLASKLEPFQVAEYPQAPAPLEVGAVFPVMSVVKRKIKVK